MIEDGWNITKSYKKRLRESYYGVLPKFFAMHDFEEKTEIVYSVYVKKQLHVSTSRVCDVYNINSQQCKLL